MKKRGEAGRDDLDKYSVIRTPHNQKEGRDKGTRFSDILSLKAV